MAHDEPKSTSSRSSIPTDHKAISKATRQQARATINDPNTPQDQKAQAKKRLTILNWLERKAQV